MRSTQDRARRPNGDGYRARAAVVEGDVRSSRAAALREGADVLLARSPPRTTGRARLRGGGHRARRELHLEAMQPLKAHVRNGRLVLDEPTDLPEGEVIELVPLDEVLASGGDYLDDEERARLHASIERGIADVRAGRTVDGREVVARLRARAAGR
jgi:hypothetical protein